MNKRIQELADQILPNEKEFHQGDPKEWGYFFSGEELEKFAELIVRECAQIGAKDPLFLNYAENDKSLERDIINHTFNKIKKELGIS